MIYGVATNSLGITLFCNQPVVTSKTVQTVHMKIG